MRLTAIVLVLQMYNGKKTAVRVHYIIDVLNEEKYLWMKQNNLLIEDFKYGRAFCSENKQ